MKNENKKEEQKRLEESEFDKNPPIELLESKSSRPEHTPDVDNRQEDLDKLKRGELGAEQFRYNDDGTPQGRSHKVDIDNEADPKL